MTWQQRNLCLCSLTVTPFQGMGSTSGTKSVTYVLRIFCYLCPRTVQWVDEPEAVAG